MEGFTHQSSEEELDLSEQERVIIESSLNQAKRGKTPAKKREIYNQTLRDRLVNSGFDPIAFGSKLSRFRSLHPDMFEHLA
jgi:hypothetical protein